MEVSREEIGGSRCDFVKLLGEMGVVFRDEARTLYQVPLITFLVPAPLRNPRAIGRPTATTGFLGTFKRNPGRLDDMVKVDCQESREADASGGNLRIIYDLHPLDDVEVTMIGLSDHVCEFVWFQSFCQTMTHPSLRSSPHLREKTWRQK